MSDIIIIGGGILGASTAYHLAKLGNNVTVIDKEEPGSATDAAAGIICPWISQRRNKVWYSLAVKGAGYYPALIHELKQDGITNTGYKKTGALVIRTEKKQAERLFKLAEERQADAKEIGAISFLSPNQIAKHMPVLSEQYFGVHLEGGARVDGKLLKQSLIDAAKKYGAKFHVGEAKLKNNSSHLEVLLNDEKMKADQIVLTNGAWLPDLIKATHPICKVKAQKAQISHIHVKNHETDEWPVVIPAGTKYIVPFSNGKIVVGTTHEDEHQFNTNVTAKGLHEILHQALHIAPGLAKAELVETKVGFRPAAPNFLPVFGRLPGYQEVYLANGLGSSGLTTGPFLGKELAAFITNQSMELDPNDYNVSCLFEE
ncbi:NAD(P)/FAD-dependent oxidoreductase [Saliterribacillus persicus]|nr:FAD-binding oxidoreductase [Saliterribacillus persicus]